MRLYFIRPDVEALRKEHMLVDMHFHTCYSHDCSTPIEQIAERARQMGVQIAITDHNTINGVIAGMKVAPDVFRPAVEITTAEGKDVIPYFYSQDELVEFFNSRIKRHIKAKSSLRSTSTGITMAELMDELQRVNAVVTLPHPFAVMPRRSYTFFQNKERRPLLRHVHAIEVINQALMHKQNLAAAGWALQFNKSIVGGTDAHILKPLGSAFTVSNAQGWEEFLDGIREKQVAVIGEERKLHHQVMDSAKNATRLLTTKANVLRASRMRRDGVGLT